MGFQPKSTPASDFHSLVKVIFHRVVERALVTCGFDIKYGKSTWIHTLFHAVEMPVDWFGKLSQRFGMYPQSSQCQSTVNIVMDNCGNLYLSKKASLLIYHSLFHRCTDMPIYTAGVMLTACLAGPCSPVQVCLPWCKDAFHYNADSWADIL